MRAKISHVLAILLVAAIASPALAADKDKKKGDKAGKHAKCPSSAVLKGAELTDEQKTKIKGIVAKFKAAAKKAKEGGDKAAGKKARTDLKTELLALMTDEQKAAIKAAKPKKEKKAKGDKKPKKEKKKDA